MPSSSTVSLVDFTRREADILIEAINFEDMSWIGALIDVNGGISYSYKKGLIASHPLIAFRWLFHCKRRIASAYRKLRTRYTRPPEIGKAKLRPCFREP